MKIIYHSILFILALAMLNQAGGVFFFGLILLVSVACDFLLDFSRLFSGDR
ncbi:hypothetical protein KAI46_06165 [bacterium]|nr:hypothetical protein [bacterium]